MQQVEQVETHGAEVLLEHIREITSEGRRALPEKARRIHALVLERQQDLGKLERQCRLWLELYQAGGQSQAAQTATQERS